MSKFIILLAGLLASVAGVAAANLPAVHWVNGSGQNAGIVLNSNLSSNGVFTTTFKTTNDLVVTRLSPDAVNLEIDVFGGPSPGNNPSYLTSFVGQAGDGTGDGTAGDITDLAMSSDATGKMQFDFLSRLTPSDRILLIDVDGPEQYMLQTYVADGPDYGEVGLAAWIAQDYSGTTGITPNAQWPVWTPAAGTLFSGANVNLDEELFVLTPDQPIDRLVITKLAGPGWSTGVTFVSLAQTPIISVPLQIARFGTNYVLNWSDSKFSLQSSASATGPFTNVLGSSSPFTNVFLPKPQFFRLIAN